MLKKLEKRMNKIMLDNFDRFIKDLKNIMKLFPKETHYYRETVAGIRVFERDIKKPFLVYIYENKDVVTINTKNKEKVGGDEVTYIVPLTAEEIKKIIRGMMK